MSNHRPQEIVILGDEATAVPFVALYEQAGFKVTVWAVAEAELATAVANLTIPAHLLAPHSQTSLALLDELDPAAFTTGMVNLTIPRNGERHGYNTLPASFMAHLAELNVTVQGRDCVVIGRGGLAVSLLYGLAKGGGHLHWLTTHLAPAYHLMQEWADLAPVPPRAYLLGMMAGVIAQVKSPLIVNASPAGSDRYAGQSLWPKTLPFPAGSFVYDVVPEPDPTALVRHAQTAACPTANGVGLLQHQINQTVKVLAVF